MKNRYLKSLTARVTILMLSFLCLAGSQGAGKAGGGSAKGPSHLLPGKAGCHCPGGQSGLSYD